MLFGNKQPDKKTEGRTRSALRFIFMPEFGRSTRQLGQTFQMFVQMLAMMFVTNGMLDKTHRFFQPGAQFTISDLFYETRARFNWRDKTKLPQNIFFIAVWGLLALSVLWMATAVFGLILGVHPAHATNATTSTSTGTMFTAPAGDLGVQYINNLFFGTGINGGPAVDFIQNALRDMLAIYSNAMLVFGSFILLYHVINMVVKAAWEGKALQGSAEIWAPLRLVLAIGMLVPLGQNLNAAQHIVIKIGEVGSGLASFAWGTFLNGLNKQFSPSNANNNSAYNDLVRPGDVAAVFRNMILIHVCKDDINTQIAEVAKVGNAALCGAGVAAAAGAAIVFPPAGLPAALAVGTICANGVILGNSISEYRGVFNDEIKYGEQNNKDLCGEISWPAAPVQQANSPAQAQTVLASSARASLESSVKTAVQQYTQELNRAAADIANKLVTKCGNLKVPCVTEVFNNPPLPYTGDQIKADIETAIAAYTNGVKTDIQASVNSFLSAAYGELTASVSADAGWAMAGAYFMKLAGIQGAITNALDVRPTARLGPMFNRVIKPEKVKENALFSNYNDVAGSIGLPVKYAEKQQEHFVNNKSYYALMIDASANGANAIGGASMAVFEPGGGADKSTDVSGLLNKLSVIVGIVDKNKFTAMLANGGNDPFTALFQFGQWLYRLAGALLIAAAGFGFLNQTLGTIIFTFSLYTFAAAIPLAFILPIIPATKFLIAVLSWLAALFEALVGMPLFALAHLNPKGETLIDAQKRGYHYLFSIMLKPLFIIFGLIAALLLSTIGIYILNTLYGIAIGTMWGDNVFYLTAIIFAGIYGFQAYGVCNACFKIIDKLPDNIYQWILDNGYTITDYDDDKLVNPVAGALFLRDIGKQGSDAGGLLTNAIKKRLGKGNQIKGTNNTVVPTRTPGATAAANTPGTTANVPKFGFYNTGVNGGGNNNPPPQVQFTPNQFGPGPQGGGPAVPTPAGGAPLGPVGTQAGGGGARGAGPQIGTPGYTQGRVTTGANVQSGPVASMSARNVPFSGPKPYVDGNAARAAGATAARDAAGAAAARDAANAAATRAEEAAKNTPRTGFKPGDFAARNGNPQQRGRNVDRSPKEE